MSQLFGAGPMPTVPTPPPSPTANDTSIQKQADDIAKNAARSGYASTFLSDPKMDRYATPNRQQKLGAG